MEKIMPHRYTKRIETKHNVSVLVPTRTWTKCREDMTDTEVYVHRRMHRLLLSKTLNR